VQKITIWPEVNIILPCSCMVATAFISNHNFHHPWCVKWIIIPSFFFLFLQMIIMMLEISARFLMDIPFMPYWNPH
jgi:hypothetical protein